MSNPKNPIETPGWFDKRRNVQLLILAFFLGCILVFLTDIYMLLTEQKEKAYFKWEQWPGFYAFFGFVATTFLVLVSKWVLRPLVMKSEDYYEQ